MNLKTVFSFPETSFQFESKDKDYIGKEKNPILESELNINSSYLEKSEFTVHLEDFLENLIKNNMQFELPSKIEIKYYDYDDLTKFKDTLKDFGQKITKKLPFSISILRKDFLYPASTDYSNGVIHICNHFKYEENEKLISFKKRFKNQSQKVLEYVFAHELGHLFLMERNKKNVNPNQDNLFAKLSLNIEEGFAEAFAIQLMCINYGKQKVEDFTGSKGNPFEEMKNQSKNTEDKALERYLKKGNSETILNEYEFPEIYKKLPFEDSNGNIETNKDIIYEKCLLLSLENNKQVVLNRLNNQEVKKKNLDKKFEKDLKKSLNLTGNNLSVESLINKFHKDFQTKGFLKVLKGIQSIRDNAFKNINDSTFKPK